jgi:DNA-binding transcriptional LysR family regulator
MAPPDFPVPAHSEWTEKIVWAAAPGVRPALDKSIPLIVLPGGNIDRIAIAALEQKGMSHTIAFSASDTTARKEAALAGVGIMAAPERFIPEGLEPIEDTFMPKLPALRAGILYKEGLDIARITPLANAFEAAVCPIQTTRAVSPRVVVSNERSPTPRGGVPSMIKF